MTLGRKPLNRKEIVTKLEREYSYGLTDAEACFNAGVSRQWLNRYMKVHPEFRDRKEQLKRQPLVMAKRVIVDAISNGDKQQANWYAERKGKDEFSTRSEVTGADAQPISVKVEFVDRPEVPE